jgi:pyruvate/2-oxoglutarate dehydrogenase complex dihydrolipoamide acyltransferase (E2) component
VGSFGGSTGTAIINPPEAAILVTGSLKERPAVVGGELVKRYSLPLSMSFDHRLIDGAEAGMFLAALKELLETPGLLLLNAV